MIDTEVRVTESRRALESAFTRFIDERADDYLPEPPALTDTKSAIVR